SRRATPRAMPATENKLADSPHTSLEFVLEHAGLRPGDVDVVALAGIHQPPDRDRQGILAEFERTATYASRLKGSLRKTPVFSLHREKRRRERLSQALGMGFRADAVRLLQQHTRHAATNTRSGAGRPMPKAGLRRGSPIGWADCSSGPARARRCGAAGAAYRTCTTFSRDSTKSFIGSASTRSWRGRSSLPSGCFVN